MNGWDGDNKGKGYMYEGWCIKGREFGLVKVLNFFDWRRGVEVRDGDLGKSCNEML